MIPAYNAQATLGRAVESALAQTQRVREIVIVDDGSVDGTAEVANAYLGDVVRLVRSDISRGAAAARNLGVGVAESPWIAFLDADDEWLPQKIEKQLAAISSSPEVSFVFCASEEFSPDGVSLGDTFRGGSVTTGKGAWKALLACNFVATPTVLARRELLLELGGFDENLKVAEDQDMWIRLALAGPLAYVPETLVKVHVRPASLSAWKIGDQTAYTLPMVERHLAVLGDQLVPSDVRSIRGARLQNAGLINCAHGDLKGGLSQLLRSALLGHRPLRAVRAMLKAPIRLWLSNVRSFDWHGHAAARGRN